jgi:hypothetical protein
LTCRNKRQPQIPAAPGLHLDSQMSFHEVATQLHPCMLLLCYTVQCWSLGSPGGCSPALCCMAGSHTWRWTHSS